jgi:hypothetical protein
MCGAANAEIDGVCRQEGRPDPVPSEYQSAERVRLWSVTCVPSSGARRVTPSWRSLERLSAIQCEIAAMGFDRDVSMIDLTPGPSDPGPFSFVFDPFVRIASVKT